MVMKKQLIICGFAPLFLSGLVIAGTNNTIQTLPESNIPSNQRQNTAVSPPISENQNNTNSMPPVGITRSEPTTGVSAPPGMTVSPRTGIEGGTLTGNGAGISPESSRINR